MPNTNRNYRRVYVILVIIILILIPLSLGGNRNNPNPLIHNSKVEISGFSKDDYKPILTQEKHGLGNITVDDIDFSELEIGFYNYSVLYPDITEDYNSGFLNMTQLNMQFVETLEPAITDNLNEEIEDNNIIGVRLNESLFVEYNNLSKGYVIYHPRLNPSILSEFYVDNETDLFELDIEIDYTIDNDGFIIFDYEDYFQGSGRNFTIYFIWECEMRIETWSLTQYTEPKLIMNAIEQNITVNFNYYFSIIGRKFGETIQEKNQVIDDVYVALTVNLPDRDLLNDHVLLINNNSVNINDHLDANNSINILLSDLFTPNWSYVSIDFTSIFTLKFIDPVAKTWGVDRLIAINNKRQRIYFPSLIAGPSHIYLRDVSFYEYTIHIDQILDAYSLFERTVEKFYLNASVTGIEGIEVIIPYIITGETCPFVINYVTHQSLTIIIADNIKMPLVGASVEVYYCGQLYGTYISKDTVQPIAPGTTNENGELMLNYVPHGNYSIRVYYNGVFLKESMVSTANNINYIYTNYPHFPFWITLFGMINGIILIVGVIFYIKSKKTR